VGRFLSLCLAEAYFIFAVVHGRNEKPSLDQAHLSAQYCKAM